MLNFTNIEKKNKSFMYQNLQKSKCHRSNFSGSNFDYVCFRGAHMKDCAFNECTFKGTEFIGANFKGSSFKKASFEYAVFEGAKLEGVDFKGAKFKKTFFVGTQVESAVNLNLEDPEITVYAEMPELELSDGLRAAIEQLMQNPFVKKARVLDTKDKKMNTLSVLILLDLFGETVLTERLSQLEAHLDRDFYTLSYLIKLIEKLQKTDQ